MNGLCRTLLALALAAPMIGTVALPPSAASPIVTLAEFQTLFPDYVNHEQQQGFQTPCVDPAGTMVLSVDITDIMGTVTEPVAIAMLCQVPGYPAFTPLGPVTFSHPGIQLLGLSTVPGHPDAFSIEYVVPLGVNTFTITIENTGWPTGCVPDIIDLAAWDLVSVSTGSASFGQLKALF